MSKQAEENDFMKLTLSPPEKLTGFEWWRRSAQYATKLGLSDTEAKQYEYDYRFRNPEEKCKTCNENLAWMLTYSPSVTFMLENINKFAKDGQGLSKENIICDMCTDTKGGGFHPQSGVLLCANWITSKWQLEDVLTHELVHVYDYLRFNLKFEDLRHHACTEIRASMLSGECRIFQEIKKTGLGNFGKKFQGCVRRRAAISVAANPNCKSPEEAEKVVDLVWNSCFNDTRPFERVYR